MRIVLSLAALTLGAGVFVAGCNSKPEPAPANDVSVAAKPAPAAPRRDTAPKPEPKAPTEPAKPARKAPAAPATEAPPTPEPAPAAAADAVTLKIDVDVPDAQVFVDRVFLGTSPVTTTDVKPGTHRLNVNATGYDGIAQTIEVKPGTQAVSVKVREVRLEASIDVIHKHRMGSCKGTLVATPQGMRYETTNKDDAFTSALLDLDGFEVDYLNKNLHIKLKQGKQFNFTDPDGNADRLFVFQRDVDKARERLKKGDPPAQP